MGRFLIRRGKAIGRGERERGFDFILGLLLLALPQATLGFFLETKNRGMS
jgi:hypothetical protein